MIRNFKALGLALMAIFALSAMTASVASANPKFTSATGVYPQHLVAEDTVGSEDEFTVSSFALTCSGETFTATLSAASNAVSFTPNYVNCKTKGSTFNNVTVTHNGCNFEFTATTTVSATESRGPVHIKCPKPLEIHHFSDEKHTTSSCTNTVVTQTATGEASYTNQAAGHVFVHGSLGVTVATHGPCTFGLTTNVNSTYHLSDTVTATSGAVVHVK